MVQENNERRSRKLPDLRPVTAQRHLDLRLNLLAKAEFLVETQGLPALRARNLAAAVGCSVGAIYNVFADLDELILAVNANTLAAIDARMATIAADDPLVQFVALAGAYLTYATSHRLRWDALFTHRLPAGVAAPTWFMARLDRTFSHIEAPLGQLRPDLAPPARTLLAHNIFAAVHGMVALGLDQRLTPIDLPTLHAQITLVVHAVGAGLTT